MMSTETDATRDADATAYDKFMTLTEGGEFGALGSDWIVESVEDDPRNHARVLTAARKGAEHEWARFTADAGALSVSAEIHDDAHEQGAATNPNDVRTIIIHGGEGADTEEPTPVTDGGEWTPEEQDSTRDLMGEDLTDADVETLGSSGDALFITFRGWEWSFERMSQHARVPEDADEGHEPITWDYSPEGVELGAEGAYISGEAADGTAMERSYRLKDVHPADPEDREQWRADSDDDSDDDDSDGGRATDGGVSPGEYERASERVDHAEQRNRHRTITNGRTMTDGGQSRYQCPDCGFTADSIDEVGLSPDGRVTCPECGTVPQPEDGEPMTDGGEDVGAEPASPGANPGEDGEGSGSAGGEWDPQPATLREGESEDVDSHARRNLELVQSGREILEQESGGENRPEVMTDGGRYWIGVYPEDVVEFTVRARVTDVDGDSASVDVLPGAGVASPGFGMVADADACDVLERGARHLELDRKYGPLGDGPDAEYRVDSDTPTYLGWDPQEPESFRDAIARYRDDLWALGEMSNQSRDAVGASLRAILTHREDGSEQDRRKVRQLIDAITGRSGNILDNAVAEKLDVLLDPDHPAREVRKQPMTDGGRDTLPIQNLRNRLDCVEDGDRLTVTYLSNRADKNMTVTGEVENVNRTAGAVWWADVDVEDEDRTVRATDKGEVETVREDGGTVFLGDVADFQRDGVDEPTVAADGGERDE